MNEKIFEVLQTLEHGETLLPCGIGNYYVSNHGRVWNGNTGQFLTPETTHHNYLRAHMSVHGEQCHKYVHELVAMAFLPRPRGSTEIHHIDGNKQNNNADNLMYVNRRQHRSLHKVMRAGGCAA